MGYPLNENETIVHAHNTYLQSAYDHGVFGGIFLLLLLFVAFLRAVMYYYKKKCDPETLSFLPMALTVGFAVTGLVEWVFHLCNPISLLFFMCIIPLSEKEQDG
jgi:O-antigen ligase